VFADFGLGHHLGESIATQEDAITFSEEDGFFANFGLDVCPWSEGPAQNVAIWVPFGFFFAEQSHIDKVLDNGVIACEALQVVAIFAKEIDATIADVSQKELSTFDHGEDAGRTHARQIFVLLPAEVDAFVGEVDGLSQGFLWLFDDGIPKVFFDGFDDEVTCDCATPVSTHPIRHDQNVSLFNWEISHAVFVG
jgi:hypothetical protein